MHPNPVFHTASRSENVTWARQRAFGTLVTNADPAPLMSHVPFLLADDGCTVELHLVRSNPIARALRAQALSAAIAVSGPDSYVSPDWYEMESQVPTWNYLAVHLRGTLELRPDGELLDLLARQSAFFEARLAPKPPWTLEKMPKDALEKLMRAIVPARLRIDDVDGTWKFNQNKPDDVRQRAADRVEISGFGADVLALSKMMRAVGPPDEPQA